MLLRFVNYCYNASLRYESTIPENRTFINKILFRLFSLVSVQIIQTILWLKYNVIKSSVSPLVDDGLAPIVSLTSFPKRIGSVCYVIYSLYMQTVLPGKIILVLTKEEFPGGMEEVPLALRNLLGKGLKIVFVEYNLRPHNKYYYSLKNYPNREVITIDDDLFYWPNTIKQLVNLHTEFNNCVCANSAVRLRYANSTLTLTNDCSPKFLEDTNVARGVFGVLYPKNFRSDELFNIDNIRKLSLNADDLWLKAQALNLGVGVVKVNAYPVPFFLSGSQTTSLMQSNVDRNENEAQWNKLVDYYKFTV
ncbi:hypothetical protein [Mucilaginibacter sp. HD30]